MRMPRRDLPPPSPPAQLRARPNEDALREQRVGHPVELARQSLGLGRLLLLWTVAAVFALGWSFLGMALMAFEEQGGALEALIGGVFAVLGLGVLVPAGFWCLWGVRRDREVRLRLRAWAGAEAAVPDPATEARLRAPGRSLGWLVSSCAMGAMGLWVTFGAAAGFGPGGATYGEIAYAMGVGVILWITGLLGAGKAVTHYRWARRAFSGPSRKPDRSRAQSRSRSQSRSQTRSQTRPQSPEPEPEPEPDRAQEQSPEQASR